MPTYLQQRRRRWYAVLEIPAKVRLHFGNKPRFIRSLETDSHSEAKRKVGRVISDWMDELERARKGQGAPGGDSDPAFWRRLLREAKGEGISPEAAIRGDGTI